MARGLAIATNYYNRINAIEDFNALGRYATSLGLRSLALKHMPPPKSGWRVIDKHLARLRAELIGLGHEPPPNPSAQEKL